MIKFKRTVCLLLVVILLCGTLCTALAADYAGEKRVSLGANLSESQIEEVYDMFGIERGDIKEITVTIDEERARLEGKISDSTIGQRSISCAYIDPQEEGSGLDVSVHNINWCTEEIYKNALTTVGITDAKVVIAAPFEVSGTGALTGIYKAYEDITGEEIDEVLKDVAADELVITSELADEIGSADAAEVVNELKKVLDETAEMSDDELIEEIKYIAEQANVQLTDEQISKLVSLVRKLEKLDPDELLEKMQSVQETVKKMSGFSEKISSIGQKVGNFFKAIGNFFSNLFNK